MKRVVINGVNHDFPDKFVGVGNPDATAYRSPTGGWRSKAGLLASFAVLSLFAANEKGAWYDPSDLSTMFVDHMGVTSATVGQPVGLMLDKSQGSTLGAEKVTNGAPASTANWTPSVANLTINNGFLRVTNSGANYGYATQQLTLTPGKTYIATYEKGGSSGVLGAISAGPGSGNLTYSTSGTRLIFTASQAAFWISVWAGQNVAGQYNEYKNISVKELPGTGHMLQSTTSKKPILRRNYNFTGPELVPNSSFSSLSIADWQLSNATAEVVGGRLRVTNTLAGSTGYASIPITTVVGATYRIAADLLPGTAGSVRLRVGTSKGASQLLAATSTNAVPAEFVATSATTWITCIINSTTVGIYAEWDNISLKEGTASDNYYLEFDGVDDWMESVNQAAAFFSFAQPNTLVGAATIIGLTTAQNVYGGSPDQILGAWSGSAVRLNAGASTLTGGVRISGQPNVLIGAVNGNTSKLIVDGTEVAAGAAGANNLAGPMYLGSYRTGTAQYLTGRYFGGVILNRLLTAAETAGITAHLKTKTGQA
jgi:hypothetical protein